MKLFRMASKRLEYQALVLAPDLYTALESWEAEVKRAFSPASRGDQQGLPLAPDVVQADDVRVIVHPDALVVGGVPTVLPPTPIPTPLNLLPKD